MAQSMLDQPQNILPHPTLGERLRRNPVMLKELRARMRGRRAFVVLTTYLLLLSAVLGVIYFVFVASSSTASSVSERGVMGKVFFGVTIWLELLTVSFVAPALTAGAISSERERQTYDLLRTTLLPARSLVLGKFFSGLVFLLLLLLVALPLESLAFLFGGVAVEEVLAAKLLLAVTAVTFCAAGVLCSSFVSRTLVSTVMSYAFAILMLFGVPMMALFALTVLNMTSPSFLNNLTTAAEIPLILAGWVLVTLNPIATGILSEIILIEGHSLWTWTVPLPSGTAQMTLISPWIPYSIFYLLLSVLLLVLSVYLVRRPQR